MAASEADKAVAAGSGAVQYVLHLFVADDKPNSHRAKENLYRLCETHLKGHYRLVVVDVLEDYQAALDNDIVVTPTLLVRVPAPPLRIVGDLSDLGRVLTALRLERNGST